MIYAIQSGAGGPIKLGHAANPRRRLANLQTGHFTPLHLRATTDGDACLERMVHEHLAEHRMRGEWFRATVPVLEMVRLMREGRALQAIAGKIVEEWKHATKAQ